MANTRTADKEHQQPQVASRRREESDAKSTTDCSTT